MAVDRELILFLARDAVLFGDVLGGQPHVDVVKGVPQAVVNHRVDDLAVADAQAFSHARQQIRTIAHRLHAAGHRRVDVPKRDRLRGEHHGLEPGAADLVDRERPDLVREAAIERRLSRRCLAQARADDIAHDALFDVAGIDAGTADRFAHHQRAEVGGGQIFQAAEKLAGRRADGADDEHFAHRGCFGRKMDQRTPLTEILRTTPGPTRLATRAASVGRARTSS